jgi:uncharacterized repeat protein (TIGR01451 family)
VALKPRLCGGTLITNTAFIADRTGGITETPPVTVTVGSYVLWISSRQTTGEDYAQPGQSLTYTLAINNTGNVPANGVRVTDTLDSQVEFASASAGGVFSGDTVEWSGLTVPAGSSITLTVAVTVTAPLTDATSIVNRVRVTGGGTSFDLPTDDALVMVYNPPAADFVVSPIFGPVPMVVTFGDRSQHATNYLWTYGDGLTSTAVATHTHTYSSGRVYTVTLRVSNPIGTDTLTRTECITTYHNAAASFTGSPTVGLWPLAVTFTNTSQYANGYVWDYGDGMTSSVAAATHAHTYAVPGVYAVALTAKGPYNSNTYTRTSYITVYEQPLASFRGTPSTGTAPLLVDFANYSFNATSCRWDFGDGSGSYEENPSHLYSNSGVYTVTLTASNPGGSDILIKPAYITVHDAPSAGFSAAPTQGLVSLSVVFTNTSQHADAYLWTMATGLQAPQLYPYTRTPTRPPESLPCH